jgi:Uncharacterized protein conserved in bacteria
MKKSQKNIAQTVKELIQPTADELGYTLWDVEYLKEGAKMILRITLDKPALDGEDSDVTGRDTINIEDCERMHRAIDPILDEADPIEDSYNLEVSSPGIERDLRIDAHYDASIGKEVELRLFTQLNGRKIITGILTSANAEAVVIDEAGGAQTEVKKTLISKARTVFDFTASFKKEVDY